MSRSQNSRSASAYRQIGDDNVGQSSQTSIHLWCKAFIISLSSFLYGYSLAALNAVVSDGKGSIQEDLPLTNSEQALASGAAVVLGSWLGVSISSIPTEALGPRKVLLLNNIFFLIGAILTGMIESVEVLYVGRFLLGLGVGFESMLVPLLLSEISPDHLRGTVTLLHQLQVTIGILVAGVMGYVMVDQVLHGWRYVQFAAGVPAALQLLFFWYVPESPRTLVKQGNLSAARETLLSVRPEGADVEEELEAMQEEVVLQDKDVVDEGSSSKENDTVTWKEVFASPGPLIIGFGLLFFQASTGINAVVFYSTTIFGFAGVDNPITGTVAFGGVNVFMTIVSVLLVDRLGRRTLLLVGTSVMTCALIFTAILLLEPPTQLTGSLAVCGVLLYDAGFAIGLGAVSWVVMNEVVPTRVRKKASSAFLSLNFFINLLIGLFTLDLIVILGGCPNENSCDSASLQVGVAYLFFIFGGLSLSAVAFIATRLPETKGKSMEEIAAMIARRKESQADLLPKNSRREPSIASSSVTSESSDIQ